MDLSERRRQINDFSTIGLAVLSLAALLPLLVIAVPAMFSGQIPQPERDEGTGAHIFQLSIPLLMPVGLVFLATADWTDPVRIARRLAFPAAVVILAFAILYYFEHVYRG